MSRVTAFALGAALVMSSGAMAEKAPCPEREVGSAYPWQNLEPIKGDRYAWVIVDVDRTGRPLRCAIGNNNIPDPDTRFLLCNAYKGDWRAPPATADDPAVRTIRRRTTMVGYEHQMADKKARKLWFRQHPDERPECYPE
ncbi:MAG TPA: hypothetical protein VF079_05880 [Sphingomicrobium sp.]